jgi:hypothetical protein
MMGFPFMLWTLIQIVNKQVSRQSVANTCEDIIAHPSQNKDALVCFHEVEN